MIKVEKLRKTFGKVVAVEDVSLQLEPGEIVGMLGPNGAGKTTTMRVIAGLVKPTAGRVTVGDINVVENPQAVQQLLGVMPDGGGLYQRLTARENIRYFAELYGMSSAAANRRIDELVAQLHMETIIDRRAAGFSHGERTKVALARAIVHDPPYVLLDEPTNGLDVLTTRAVRDLLKQLRAAGKVVVFSSHLMHEVDHLCDRAIVIAKGRVVASGDLTTLKQQHNADNFEEVFVRLAYPENGSSETIAGGARA